MYNSKSEFYCISLLQTSTGQTWEEKANLQHRSEQADQRTSRIEMENHDLHRQVQQLQEQVSTHMYSVWCV